MLHDEIISAIEDTIVWDKCGKHGNHRQISEDVCELIRDHIHSFPAQSSQYSRSNNSGRVYLSPELSIACLYRDFLEKHDPEIIKKQEENRERVVSHQPQKALPKPLASQHFYHDIFVTEFNIYFGYPRLDMCDTCDSLTNKIDHARAVGEDTQELEKELEAHKELT